MKRPVIVSEALGVAAAKRHRSMTEDLTELEKLFVALADDYTRLESVLEAAETQIKKYDGMLGDGVVTNGSVMDLKDGSFIEMEGDTKIEVTIWTVGTGKNYEVKVNSNLVDITEVIKEIIKDGQR